MIPQLRIGFLEEVIQTIRYVRHENRKKRDSMAEIAKTLEDQGYEVFGVSPSCFTIMHNVPVHYVHDMLPFAEGIHVYVPEHAEDAITQERKMLPQKIMEMSGYQSAMRYNQRTTEVHIPIPSTLDRLAERMVGLQGIKVLGSRGRRLYIGHDVQAVTIPQAVAGPGVQNITYFPGHADEILEQQNKTIDQVIEETDLSPYDVGRDTRLSYTGYISVVSLSLH